MRGRLRPALIATALGSATVLAGFGSLLSPAVALGTRDIARFHLPLRTAFVRLAADGGIPVWNPWLHSGQPILSNPNYAAFYPPTWLSLLAGPVYGLSLILLLHVALGFAGAWVLARRLGCGLSAAALAAVGFAGSSAFLSLTASFNLLCSFAWLPWVLAATERLLQAGGDEPWKGWVPSAIGGGAALAATLLAGDPAGTLIAALAALCLGVRVLRRPRRLGRLLILFVVAMALATVQWLPAWGRLVDSPRSEPLPLAQATQWSTPPLRLVEVVLPRLWGDAARSEEGLFFGWNLHDLSYPYIISIYPGLLVSLLGISALVRGPLRNRAGWVTAVALGVFLAIGRHNPVYSWLHFHVPLLGRTRYPEKFLLLTLAALPFVAALGWQHLLSERRRGRRTGVDLPLALAMVLLVSTTLVAIVLPERPGAVATFIRAGSPLPPSENTLARDRKYLGREAWAACATSAAGVLVLALYRWRRIPNRWVAVSAVAFLAIDLWHFGHRIVVTVPSDLYLRAPPLVTDLRPTADLDLGGDRRIYRQPSPEGSLPQLVFELDQPTLRHLELTLDRIDPLSGLLWGVVHSFPPDYDLMLTGRASRNRSILDQSWESAETAFKILGAWSVEDVISLRSDEERLQAALEGRHLAPARVSRNPYRLPPYRFVPQVVVHAEVAEALAATRQGGYDLIRIDHWVGSGPTGLHATRRMPELSSVEGRGGAIEIRYHAPEEGHLIAAITWDPGWTARIDVPRDRGNGTELPVFQTAIGQIGCLVPAGEHRLRLEYRDRWVSVGATVSAVSALLVLLPLSLSRLRRHPPLS